MMGGVVDQERLDRREKSRAASPMRGTGSALRCGRAAQFLKDKLAAGRLMAAQDTAFKLGDKHGASLRLERPQIIAQPFDGLPVARHAGHHLRWKASNTFSRRPLKKGLHEIPGIAATGVCLALVLDACRKRPSN